MRKLLTLPAIAWAGLIFWLSSRPRLPSLPITFIGMDKLAHACAYGVLGLLVLLPLLYRRRTAAPATPGRVSAARIMLVVTSVACIYGASDELHQAFVPGRTPDVLDLLADVAGALLATSLWLKLAPRWRRERSSRGQEGSPESTS